MTGEDVLTNSVESPTVSRRSVKRVLLVEDNPDGREMLRWLLDYWGHDVVVAADGFQGFEKAIAWRPDVAIVDIGLPGWDGYEVARRVRAALGKEVYLIALTAYGRPEDRQRALDSGFDVHITKPADLGLLAHLVEEGKPAL